MARTYEAMQKGSNTANASRWNYLNLKNRKQTGDLEKKMLHFKKKNNFNVFNFTSCRGREGVSTVLANLMGYLEAQKSGKKVLIIDANYSAPSLHKIFNVSNERGLTDTLLDGGKVGEIAIPLDTTNISLLCSGKRHRKQAGDLGQEKFADLIQEAKPDFDYILIDSPGMLTSSDSVSTAVASDATFLIIESLKVQKEVALKTKALFADNECIIAGVVLNKIRQVIPSWMYKVI